MDTTEQTITANAAQLSREADIAEDQWDTHTNASLIDTVLVITDDDERSIDTEHEAENRDTNHERRHSGQDIDDEDEESLPDLVDKHGESLNRTSPKRALHELMYHISPPNDDDEDQAVSPVIIQHASASTVLPPKAPPRQQSQEEVQHSTRDTLTGTAAKLLTDADHDEILHMDISFDMYAAPTVIMVPINRLPTLGLILAESPTTSQFFCQKLSRRHSGE